MPTIMDVFKNIQFGINGNPIYNTTIQSNYTIQLCSATVQCNYTIQLYIAYTMQL